MLKAVVTASVIALVYLCQRPELIARAGLHLHLNRQGILTWFSKQAYRSAVKVFELVHQRPPSTQADEIARFEWLDKDAQLVVRVQTAIHDLADLQTTEVPTNLEVAPDYTSLFDEVKLSFSEFSDWHDFGFQGQNPATDFRGVGKLGVLLLHGFCTKNSTHLHRILLESHSATQNTIEQKWYPVALVSIRLSMALCEALKREKLLMVSLLQQSSSTRPLLSVVQHVHDRLLLDFHDLWLASVERGDVKTYFDNELVLKTFEGTLPLRIYGVATS